MSKSKPLSIKEGRKFSCTMCGNCCFGSGVVHLREGEIEKMAQHLEIPIEEFVKKYNIKYSIELDKIVILITREQDRCPLLTEDNKCSVHAVKPVECITYPFWSELLDDEEEWEAAKAFCPGLDSGKKYSYKEIMKIRKQYEKGK